MRYKILVTLALFLAVFKSNSMESQLNLDKAQLWHVLPQQIRYRILNYVAWHSLPKELKFYIISYMLKSTSIKKMAESLNTIAQVNREFFLISQDLINAFTKNYITQCPDQAYVDFFAAVQKNKMLIVKALVNNGIDVNIQNIYGNTALIIAANNGCKEIVELLVNAGANVDVKNFNGETALISAITNGHEQIVRVLLSAHADINVTDDEYGWDALTYAISGGNAKIIGMLMDAGAQVDEQNIRQSPAFSPAIKRKYQEISDSRKHKNSFEPERKKIKKHD